jgi:hypothetical protein
MQMTRGWTGPKASVIALAVFAGAVLAAASTSKADSLNSLINYSTTGTVDPNVGVNGPSVISFDSVAKGAFAAPSAFSLGSFQVAPLPTGVSTTYTNTPFQITYLTNAINGTSITGTPDQVVLNGYLNGTITGGSQSSVLATFSPSSPITFQTDGLSNSINVLGQSLALVPSTTNGGLTTAQAQIVVSGSLSGVPVPEPTSIAVFVLALGGGFGFKRRLRRAGQEEG